MKKGKTTKRLATLSAAFLVGSVATFGADVDVGANAETTAKAALNEAAKRTKRARTT